MIFTEPKREEVIRKTIPNNQTVSPFSAIIDNGGYMVHPDAAAPPSMKKLANIMTPPTKYDQYDAILSFGNAMSGAPICRGTT
jgi:hypothetical protein